MRLREIGKTVANSIHAWIDDDATTDCAAISYYALFSIAPLIIIALSLSDAFFGASASHEHIYPAIQNLLGESGNSGVSSMIKSVNQSEAPGLLAAIIGALTLVIGSTSVFAQLQDTLNKIWRVQPKNRAEIYNFFRKRCLSFLMVLVVVTIILASTLLSLYLHSLGKTWKILIWDFPVSFVLLNLLFSAIFKILPDIDLHWADVWEGGAVTAFLFLGGKELIGIYVSRIGLASSYGVASSAVALLLWTYYSSAILLFGAEYTRQVSRRRS